MTTNDAVALFTELCALVKHGSPFKAYASWLPEKSIEDPTYVGLALKLRDRYDILVFEEKLPERKTHDTQGYGELGMNVAWPKGADHAGS